MFRVSFEVSEKNGKVIEEDNDGDLVSWEPYGKMDKHTFNRRVWRNIVILSIAFMLNYIAYGGLSALQSSLHVQDGNVIFFTHVSVNTMICRFVIINEKKIGSRLFC